MGDNASETYSKTDDNTSSPEDDSNSSEEVIFEEYETIYLPSNILVENQDGEENDNILEHIKEEEEESSRRSCQFDTTKSHKVSNIKTITKIDDETENVVILIRPRQRSVSPSVKDNSEKEIGTGNFENEDSNNIPQETYIFHQLNDNRTGNCMSGYQTKSNRNDIPFFDEQTGTSEKDFINDNSNRNEINGNQSIDPVSNEKVSSEPITINNNYQKDYTNIQSEQVSEQLKVDYETQGARPKTFVASSAEENSHIENTLTKSTSRCGISQEANERIKQLRATGKYDEMVKNCNMPSSKSVVRDLVKNVNTCVKNRDSDITEEDDFLIWQLMKSLKERSIKDQSEQHKNSVSDSIPPNKCDWSYEKATLKKDKYLSRRLRTKESGQVKVVTFMSPSKDTKEIKITPLKVSKTLPFNVKHIFQQKMDELKNKNCVCLTGGKELMFTTINIDNPYFKCLELNRGFNAANNGR